MLFDIKKNYDKVRIHNTVINSYLCSPAGYCVYMVPKVKTEPGMQPIDAGWQFILYHSQVFIGALPYHIHTL